MIENYDSVDVFVGVDVGKGEHHAVALNKMGKVVFDKALPNDEGKMRAVLQTLKQHGTVLVVVDQPATIGALPIAVAQAEEVLVGYLPGLAMRRIADLHAGEAKTDVLTELVGLSREDRRRRRFASARFCSHGQRRERSAGTVRVGGAAVGCAEGHRQSLRTVSAG